MSGCSILWRPAISQWDYTKGGSELRKALECLYGIPVTLGESQIPELRGIAAAGVEGAQCLIDAILENGDIEIKAEC